MAEFEPSFERGKSSFRLGKYEDALTCLNESITKGGRVSQLFDSRAPVHEKLGDLKVALEDACRE
ncbi:hypothetical protein BJ322DRAFT_1102664 [Thelephora terrestris]|uniref:Tetratricopeptide repeat protein n=1 Tax=Thelephora terrestris TaxID=56493 RepID=A0A9P6HQQ0_9AGAM|nr:hypothetical protein BJ322DRAFT_1102664 [Thelephora terrestris]